MYSLLTTTSKFCNPSKTNTAIYIFEFKLHDTAENALKQIHEKNYAQSYGDDGRPITLIGAVFDEKERNIEHWVTEAS